MAIINLTARYPIPLVWPRLAYTLSKIHAIAIHHSVTSNLPLTASQAQEMAVLDAIHRHHVAKGFGGIGYHLCAFPSGRIYQTAKLIQWGANVGGRNSELYGVCYIGTYTNTVPSQRHQVAVAEGVDAIDKFLGRKVALRPHRLPKGWTSTACPGQAEQTIPGLRALIPAPPPSGIWREVRAISKNAHLYEATNLVNLPDRTLIKPLAKDLNIEVRGIWRNMYISRYSMERKIPAGFAVSATIPPSCQAERDQIAALLRTNNTLKAQLAAERTRAAALRDKLARIHTISG